MHGFGSNGAMRGAFRAPAFTSEAEDIDVILDCLGISASSDEAKAITGPGKCAISEIRNGQRVRDARQRRHIAVVAEVVRRLIEAQTAAVRRESRRSAVQWLNTARVRTPAGTRTPLEVLSDLKLAFEALSDLSRSST